MDVWGVTIDDVDGAVASTVGAATGVRAARADGVPADRDRSRLAIPAALDEAPRRGCAGIVVDHHPSQDSLQVALRAAGLRSFADGRTHRSPGAEPGPTEASEVWVVRL
ncbi:hypothetical protein, partial [Jatrophihabitans endophyticus]|uniref:hypothetical protein n=1 Tax=Jatrophihabitans endophyticus TaxID=1206085 RepID=UPI0019F561CC